MLKALYTNKIKKEYKQAIKRGCDKKKLQELILELIRTGTHSDLF